MIVILGPKNVGKTCLTKRLADDKDCKWSGKTFDEACPAPQTTTGVRTGGFSTASGQRIALREIGPTMFPMWKGYLSSEPPKKVIYMIDGTNRTQVAVASQQFKMLCSCSQADNLKLALVINKCECPDSMSNAELREVLALDRIASSLEESLHPAIFKISILKGSGMEDLVSWMAS